MNACKTLADDKIDSYHCPNHWRIRGLEQKLEGSQNLLATGSIQEKNCSPSGKFETGCVRRKRSSVVTRVTVSEFSDQGTKGVSEGLSRREREESV